MSGGKGGGSTTTVEVPEYIEKAAQRNLNKAEGISQIGYTPYYGPDVAAFTPMQQAAFQNTADASSAFGMAAPTNQQDIMGGMGAPTTYANGVSGYSSQPMFRQSLEQLQAERPGQFDYINSFFIDPFTGQAGSRVSAPVNYENYMTAAESGRVQADADRANALAIAQAQAGAGPQYVSNMNLTQNELDNYATTISPDMSYNPTTDVLNQDQRSYVDSSTDAQIAQYDVDSNILGDANNSFMDDLKAAFGVDPTFDSPSSAGSYGGSLVTGEATETNDTPADGFVFDPTDFSSDYGSASDFSFTGPETTLTSDGTSSTYSGDYSNIGSSSDPVTGVSEEVDLPGNVISRALNIGAGKKDDSDDGFVGSHDDGCFLTTAIVNRRGEDDDGPTLSKLRNFRDTYMSSSPEMAENIKEYYNVAPKIVSSIPEDHKDWDWIGQQVDKSVEHIDANEMSEAYDVYSNMVSRLMSNWVEKKEAL